MIFVCCYERNDVNTHITVKRHILPISTPVAPNGVANQRQRPVIDPHVNFSETIVIDIELFVRF